MEPVFYLYAAILGIVEGLTEFLPVSSTGHLILAGELLGFDKMPSAKMFTVVIQLGAILAVCWLYRVKLFDIAFHIHKKPQQLFTLKIIVGFLPAAVIGLAFHNQIEEYLFTPLVVAISLVVGGVAIWIIEKKEFRLVTHEIDDMSLKQAFLVGCAQVLAMIPGTSRSGATIMGGVIFGLDRKVATEFSFFLAIPVMFGATLLDVVKYYGGLTTQELYVLAIGFVISFLSALAAIKGFIAYVARHDFMVFAYYRIIFGGLMLAYYIFM